MICKPTNSHVTGSGLQAGFSLIELMVALAIGAILLMIALPSFESFIRSNSVRTQVRDVGGVLSYARSEAIARGDAVAVCGSDNGSSCNNGADWSEGLLVFVDDGAGSGTANDNSRTGAEEVLRRYEYTGQNSLVVSDSGGNAVSAIRFLRLGSVHLEDSLTLRICDPDNQDTYARAILLERTGRVSPSYDLHDTDGADSPDGIHEDVNGDNLNCS